MMMYESLQKAHTVPTPSFPYRPAKGIEFPSCPSDASLLEGDFWFSMSRRLAAHFADAVVWLH